MRPHPPSMCVRYGANSRPPLTYPNDAYAERPDALQYVPTAASDQAVASLVRIAGVGVVGAAVEADLWPGAASQARINAPNRMKAITIIA